MAKNSRVVAVAAPTIYEKIDRCAELQRRLDEAEFEYMHAQEAVRGKNSELIEVKNEIGSYLNAEGQLSDKRYQGRLEDARKRAEKTQSALEAARKKLSSLKDEIDSLEHNVAQSRDGGGTGFEEVLDFQRQVEAARAEVARIGSIFEEQHQIRANALARLQSDDRSAERAELAAKISLGEINEQRLKEFDAETEKQQQAMDRVAAEALPVIEAADSAIVGLERKLEAARRALAELEAKRPAVLAMFFHSVAEVEGARFVELARDLFDCYLKLSALDQLLGGNVLVSHSHHRMLIPNFTRLKVCQGLGRPHEEWTLFSAQHADFGQARQKLIEQLQALGVQISS